MGKHLTLNTKYIVRAALQYLDVLGNHYIGSQYSMIDSITILKTLWNST